MTVCLFVITAAIGAFADEPLATDSGTANDPVKAVDGDDLAALVSGGYASDGSYFTTGGVEIGDFARNVVT